MTLAVVEPRGPARPLSSIFEMTRRAGRYDEDGSLRALNRAWWDERVPIHLESDFYDLERFRTEPDRGHGFVYEELGDVAGATLVHLQCHIGLDTLTLARRGARVTGLDFSEPAIEAARSLAGELGLSARAHFVAGDVYDARAAIAAEGTEPVFDVVFTGIGALGWLPDIERWAAVVASLLAPGGRLYVAEFHPITDVLDEDGAAVVGDYFRREPHVFHEAGSYVDRDAPTECNTKAEWQHGLGEVVSALVRAGLRIDFLHEHALTYFERYRTLERHENGFRYPAGGPSVPLMYSLQAGKA